MVEGEDNYHRDSITGRVLICYWNIVAWREHTLDKETSLPVSGEECLRCSLEKCLSCSNYCPSTKTYSEKGDKK